MRKLSLKTYTEYYLKRHSQDGSKLNIRKLEKEMMTHHERLRVPLLIYAVVSGKQPKWKEERSRVVFAQLQEKFNHGEQEFLDSLKNHEEGEFRKYIHSFESENQRRDDEGKIKELYREVILKLKAEKKMTDYFLYHSCHINSGNYHRFLYEEMNNALSRQKCQEILSVCQLSK